MTIRRVWSSCVLALLVVACSSNAASPDDGKEDTKAGECREQAESFRDQYCGDASNAFFTCDKGTPPPAEDCTASEEANSYCCPVVAETKPSETVPGKKEEGESPVVDYPAGKTGWTVGAVIPNLSMQGYAADSSKEETISLADFYDPEANTNDVLVIVGGTAWDIGSKATLQIAEKSKEDRFKVLMVLGQGPKADVAATLEDLSSWRAKNPWAAHGLDANFKLFGPAFDVAAVPLLMFVDTSTMKICEMGVGAQGDQQKFDESIAKCRP